MFRSSIRCFFLLLCFLLSLPLTGTGQQKPGVVTLVPAAPWRMISQEKLDRNSVSRWGGDPLIEGEYRVQSVDHRVYELQGSNTQADVVIAESPDASAAYGLYTYYQADSMTPVPSMQLAVADSHEALIARGRYFIRVPRPQPVVPSPAKGPSRQSRKGGRVMAAQASPALSENDFRALLILVTGSRPSANSLAALPASLPTSGLVPGSERYLLGKEAASHILPGIPLDLLGFEQGAEVQVASYQAGPENRARVLAISYPNPQISRQRFKGLESGLSLNQDRDVRSVYGKRSGSYVFLAVDASSRASADRFLGEFSVARYVSWNERYFGDKPVAAQMLRLIISNLLLVLLLISLAIGGGAAIVLSKRLSRKFFPQFEWAREEAGALITLNLK